MQPIASLRPGDRAAVMGQIKSTQLADDAPSRLQDLPRGRRRRQRRHPVFVDEPGVSWPTSLTPRASVVIFGDVRLDSTGLHFLNPEFELVGEDLAALNVGRIVPFYERTGTVTPNMQRRLVRQVLDGLPRRASRPPARRTCACAGS